MAIGCRGAYWAFLRANSLYYPETKNVYNLDGQKRALLLHVVAERCMMVYHAPGYAYNSH